MAPTIVIDGDASEQFASPVKSAHGFAFEVLIKSPVGAKAMSGVRARLESGSLSASPSPSKEESKLRRQHSRELAESAREKNLKKQEVVERAGASFAERQQRMSEDLASKVEQASEKRRESLIYRSSKAGKHFNKVKAAMEIRHQRKDEEVTALQERLDKATQLKDLLHAKSLSERRMRACQHNTAVASKVLRQQQSIQKRKEELCNKLAKKRGQADCAFKQKFEKHGSKVNGNVWSSKDISELLSKQAAGGGRSLVIGSYGTALLHSLRTSEP